MKSTSSVDWGALDIEARRVDFRTCKRREKNAHYMPPAMFRRLVENIKIDGGLTTAVLLCENKDGSLEILSGHHRSAAAIEAGYPEGPALVITTPLSENRKIAIQLSHNAINGNDDESLLADLYSALDIDAKKFSGLDDSILGTGKGLSVMALGSAAIKYDELLFAFLPEDAARFEQEIASLAKRAKKRRIHAAPHSVFDGFFDTLVRTKHQLNIVNSAIALTAMAQLAAERLDQLEREGDGLENAA